MPEIERAIEALIKTTWDESKWLNNPKWYHFESFLTRRAVKNIKAKKRELIELIDRLR